MAKKETGSDILKSIVEGFTKEGRPVPESIQNEYNKVLEEEIKLLADKKAAAVERKKELKAVRDAERKAKNAQLKAAQTATKTAEQVNSRLSKLKERVAANEQTKAPPSTTAPSVPSAPSNAPASGGFFSDALESATESEYNSRDTKAGRRQLLNIGKSLAKNLIYKPIAGTVKAAGLAAGGILSSEYMGLGGPVAAGLAGYSWLTSRNKNNDGSGTSDRGGRSRTLSSLLGMGGKQSSKETSEVSILKRILDNTETTNEKLEDVSAALERQESSSQEDRREIKQQNDQIIELLQIIAAGSKNGRGAGAAGEGTRGGTGGSILDSLKNGLGALAGLLGLGALWKGAKGLIKGGIGLAVKGAKFIGRGITKGAGLVAGGVSSLFGKGEAKSAEAAGEIAAKTSEQAGETGAKLESKEGGKAAEKVLAKEGEKAAEKGAVKAAGKGGIKAIVAKVIGPKVAKVVAKGIPFVGALAGLGFGISRAMEGDWKGAGAEVAGGVASIFPGVGTAASVATDVGLLARDVYKEAYGVFPEDDPKSGERLEEVKKEVMDYIDGTVSAKETSAAPGAANPNAPTAAGNAGNAPTAGTITAPSTSSGEVPVSAASPGSVVPVSNPAVGFNQGSTQMALSNGTTPPPVIINNNNVTSTGGGGSGGKGVAPSRTSGTPSTSPKQSHIDRALYGDLYGAGVP